MFVTIPPQSHIVKGLKNIFQPSNLLLSVQLVEARNLRTNCRTGT